MLEVRQLAVSRDDRTLFRALDVALAPGQVLQVAGPNGVGKTTLLSVVAGLCQAEAGELFWQGRPVGDDPATFRAAFTWLGHQPGLKLMLTPRENLAWLLRLRGLPAENAVVDAALARVGLQGYEDVAVARLSAGQKRRAALARLFLERRPLWILDEPFTALDRAGVIELEGWLRDHAAAGGLVLLTTHHEFSDGFPLRRLELADFRPAFTGLYPEEDPAADGEGEA